MTQLETTRRTRNPTLFLVICVVWLAMIAAATGFDGALATRIRESGIDHMIKGKWFAEVLKFPGNFLFTLILVGIGLVARKLSRHEALILIFAGALSGANWLIKWCVGRSRPFRYPQSPAIQPFKLRPFSNGLSGLIHQTNLSFPSGHACTAFALATAVLLIRPRWCWIFFLLATLVAVERVVENAHYLSDVIAGAGVGAAGSIIVYRLMNRRIPNAG